MSMLHHRRRYAGYQARHFRWEVGTANAKVALQHNLGLGGACVVTMYRRD